MLEYVEKHEEYAYQYLCEYREIMSSIEPQDFAMLMKERLNYRERAERRYDNSLASPKSSPSYDSTFYKKAKKIRDMDLSHITYTIEKLELKHPKFTQEYTLSQSMQNHRGARRR